MSTHTESIAHPAVEELELGAVLHALSDPVRLQIVAKLAHSDGDHTCGSFGLPVTKSTCTHHFKVLREAGVIHQRAQGTTRLNRLRREDLDRRFPGLLGTILQAAEVAGRARDSGADAATLAGITADVAAAMSAGGQPMGPAVA
ncbi:MAG TPA: helix-turn-helix transcriptional regulator [Solirubrobacteraceae bacterium]|jgi:DNA-binding transcriptional ArsR family regulator